MSRDTRREGTTQECAIPLALKCATFQSKKRSKVTVLHEQVEDMHGETRKRGKNEHTGAGRECTAREHAAQNGTTPTCGFPQSRVLAPSLPSRNEETSASEEMVTSAHGEKAPGGKSRPGLQLARQRRPRSPARPSPLPASDLTRKNVKTVGSHVPPSTASPLADPTQSTRSPLDWLLDDVITRTRYEDGERVTVRVVVHVVDAKQQAGEKGKHGHGSKSARVTLDATVGEASESRFESGDQRVTPSRHVSHECISILPYKSPKFLESQVLSPEKLRFLLQASEDEFSKLRGTSLLLSPSHFSSVLVLNPRIISQLRWSLRARLDFKNAARSPETDQVRAMKVKLEFSGGAELLVDKKKEHEIVLSDEHPWTIRSLLEWIRTHMLGNCDRPEMLIERGTVRPGILVLINECDWELLGEIDARVNDGDTVSFISTLHGG